MSTEIDWTALRRRLRSRRQARAYQALKIVCSGCGRPCGLCEDGCDAHLDAVLDRRARAA